jgi:hypothetical protein
MVVGVLLGVLLLSSLNQDKTSRDMWCSSVIDNYIQEKTDKKHLWIAYLAFSDSQQPLSTHLLTYVHHQEVLSSSLIERSTGSNAKQRHFQQQEKTIKKAIFYYYWPCRLDNNAIFDEVDAK